MSQRLLFWNFQNFENYAKSSKNVRIKKQATYGQGLVEMVVTSFMILDLEITLTAVGCKAL